jgi:segregation and condensation protein A
LQRNCTFEELFDQDHTRYDVVVTFLALLEMAKLRLARVYQAEAGAAIHVQYALLDADAPTVPPPGESAEGAGSTLAESVADLRVTSDVVEGVEDAHAHEDEYEDEYELRERVKARGSGVAGDRVKRVWAGDWPYRPRDIGVAD